MKVLAITADIFPEKLGGAERHFVEIAKRLISKLEKLAVLVGNGGSIKKILPDAEIITVSYPRVPNFFGLFYILWATPKAIALTRGDKYDLIWAKQEYPQAQVGALVKLITKIPLYITSQNPLLGEEEFIGFGGKLATFLVSLAFRQADIVAAVSAFSAHAAKKLGAKKVFIIPNGV